MLIEPSPWQLMVMLKQRVPKTPAKKVDHYMPLERRMYVYVVGTDK